jgi:iron complex outermembrane receptor protein
MGPVELKPTSQNIPLTSGEGDTTIEDIDMETIGGIEIKDPTILVLARD